jgi:hypothetical protein
MNELELLYLSQLFRFWTVGLCLGVSSLAMTFYFYVVRKGFTVKAENQMMHIVYTVLRIGMALVCVSEFTTFIYNYHINNFIYWTDNPELLMRLSIFTIIVINAIAMQKRWISMWLGPVFAGGSWYAYFFFSVWIETESTYLVLLAGYGCWLIIVAALLIALRLWLTREQSSRLGDGASLAMKHEG